MIMYPRQKTAFRQAYSQKVQEGEAEKLLQGEE